MVDGKDVIPEVRNTLAGIGIVLIIRRLLN